MISVFLWVGVPAASWAGDSAAPASSPARKLEPRWTRLVEHAPFSPRDTAEGTVFAGKMWLSNGWAPTPKDKLGGEHTRDLWNSKDGVTWTRVSENTPYDVYSEMIVFEGKLWAVKGSVWNSTDGVEWTRVLEQTPFGGRGYGELVVFKGRMWQLGSGADVWSTRDGVNWDCVTKQAAYGDRAATAVEAFDGKLWLMAGRTEVPNNPPEKGYKNFTTHNDVWCSQDGKDWTRLVERAPWAPRQWCVAAVYADRLWVIGGHDNVNSKNLGDVWTTRDGKDWQRFEAGPQFAPRHEVTPYVFDGSLWVVAGNTWPVVNDVWRVTLPGAGAGRH